MAEYKLSCTVTVGASTIVEAKSFAEAYKIALNRDVVFAENGVNENEIWVIHEPDGVPTDVVLDD
jgi:hypothetical protein